MIYVWMEHMLVQSTVGHEESQGSDVSIGLPLIAQDLSL